MIESIAPDAAQRLVVPFAVDLARHSEQIALITSNSSVSYRELAQRVQAAAQELGGQRRLVMVAGANAVEPIVMYLAALAAGHPVILAPGDNESSVESLVTTYDPDVLLRRRGGTWQVEQRHEQSAHRLHADLALLLTTSGSTGSPKLVRLSHENLQANAAAIAGYLDIRDTDRAATTLPMHYCYGLSVINSHLFSGAALVLSESSVVDDEFWELVRQHGVTSFAGVPYTFELLDRVGFAKMALPSLRYITQAGGRMAPETVRRFAQLGRRDGWDLYVMYGQTEATARMSYLPPELASEFPHTIGVPVAAGSFRLEPVAEYDEPDTGELVYCGPNVMLGYADGPGDLMLGRTVNHLRTGDVARRTENGLYEVFGRLGRSVKIYGLRVDLDRVEQVLGDNGVTGLCLGGGDELVVAVGRAAQVAHVRSIVATHCGLPARAIRVCRLDHLPRLPSGKPDYRALQEQVGSVPVPDVPRPRTSIENKPVDAAALRQLFAELLDAADVTDNSSFVSLGGDSLSYVEMSVRLEDVLGELPAQWHTMPIRELVPSAPAPAHRRRTIEVSVVLRAAAIVLIVANHAHAFAIVGGAHVLLGVAGYNFARFHLTSGDRRTRARHLAASLVRIVVPTVVWIAIMLLIGSNYRVTNLLLLNGFLGPERKGPEWHFWFVEALVYILVAVGGLLVAVPWLHRLERRFPFGSAIVLVGLALLTRYEVIAFDIELARFKAHMVLWLFALGWAAARAVTMPQRVLVTIAVIATVPGFFGNTQREALVIAGLCLLLWVSSIRVPKAVGTLAGVLAASSLYIYLTHWQVYPHLRDHALLATLVSVVAGVAYWRVMHPLTARISARLAAPSPPPPPPPPPVSDGLTLGARGANGTPTRPRVLASAMVLLLGVLAGCGGASDGADVDEDKLVVYSGRQEQLVAPVIEDFTEATGIEVSVRYGNTAQLAAQLVEEGDRTPADVFFSQDGGALGALTKRKLLTRLPEPVLAKVPATYRADDGTWVGVSGRSRVIVYNPKAVPADQVPDSVFALTDPAWKGAVGIAPSNASFEAFVTAIRVLRGDAAAREWLKGMKANDVQTFDNNIAILNAAEDGVIKLGLINHYYWYEQVAEEGPAAVPARLKFLPGGDPGALVNVAGAGVLAHSDRRKDARRFVEFLLSKKAQTFFAEETKEYPLIPGVPIEDGLPPLDSLEGPNVDLSDLDTLEETLAMIEDAGLT